MESYEPSSTEFTLVKNEDYWNTKWQLTEEIKTAFDKNNIEIPFPQMDVNIQKRSIDSDF